MSLVDDPRGSSCFTFSIGNPFGPGVEDVAGLLRRMADAIDEIDGIEVVHLVYDSWPMDGFMDRMMTVYYTLPPPRGEVLSLGRENEIDHKDRKRAGK